MSKILILGAGRSSSNLTKYLLEHSEAENWTVRVGDLDADLAARKVTGFPKGESFRIVPDDTAQRKAEIAGADLVISMLPAFMHPEVARECIAAGKHLITPSYVSDEMWELDAEARRKGVMILNEMGVDPGIDHMSAMQIVHELERSGAVISRFESFTGGLIAPESDDNPWNYKITWNPRNVVLAGYGGTARYQEDHRLKFIPYHRLFTELTEVEIDGYGAFEGYANRDSVKYTSIYGMNDLPTIYRGTLRRKGFCRSWNALVQMGLTDDSFVIPGSERMTWRSLTSSFVTLAPGQDPEEAVRAKYGADPEIFERLRWLGIFEERPLGAAGLTPATALQRLIEEKWALKENDKDMIVMWHRFIYEKEGKTHEKQSSMVCLGDDPVHTAMSRTVGLPIAVAAKFILQKKLNLTGVLLPITPEIYEPVLRELSTLGIQFVEKDIVWE